MTADVDKDKLWLNIGRWTSHTGRSLFQPSNHLISFSGILATLSDNKDKQRRQTSLRMLGTGTVRVQTEVEVVSELTMDYFIIRTTYSYRLMISIKRGV